jgi:uncharacterized protein (DUF1697 family)
MTTYVALLRAVNVGGANSLPMAKLRFICSDAGFTRVETYIASGNVVFKSNNTPSMVKSELENRLLAYSGKHVGVLVRTASEMLRVVEADPFPESEPRHTYTIFLDGRPPRDALAHAVGQCNEKMCLGDREIYVWYPNGMGRSKLRIPAAKMGTARNINTVAKLVEIAKKP